MATDFVISSVLIILIISIAVAAACYFNMSPTRNVPITSHKREGFTESRDFYIYNYYKVPITVIVQRKDENVDNSAEHIKEVHHTFSDSIENNIHYQIPDDTFVKADKLQQSSLDLLVVDVPSGGRKGISFNTVARLLRNNATVHIVTGNIDNKPSLRKRVEINNSAKLRAKYDAQLNVDTTRAFINGTLKEIGRSTLRIPSDKTIKALHAGMNSGHTDLSYAPYMPKSSLGSALATIRLVNNTPRTLHLYSGWKPITISPFRSLMYYGENEQGTHLGSTLRDVDGILPDYVIDKPVTDIHLGIVSDSPIALYTDSKYDGDLDDTTAAIDPDYAFSIYGLGGPSAGAEIDRTIIH